MNFKEMQYAPGACQQTVIYNTLYSFILYPSFKQIGILHAFSINFLARHWIERQSKHKFMLAVDRNNLILISSYCFS